MSNKFTKTFSRIAWIPYQTPISAANLNRLEEGIEHISQFLKNITESGIALGSGVIIGNTDREIDENTQVLISGAEDIDSAVVSDIDIHFLRNRTDDTSLLHLHLKDSPEDESYIAIAGERLTGASIRHTKNIPIYYGDSLPEGSPQHAFGIGNYSSPQSDPNKADRFQLWTRISQGSDLENSLSISANGSTLIKGSAEIYGRLFVKSYNSNRVLSSDNSGNFTFTKNVSVLSGITTNALTVNNTAKTKTLEVSDTASFSGTATFNGDVYIKGTAHTETQQNLSVKDAIIVTNADGTDISLSNSGIVIRTGKDQDYGILFEPGLDGGAIKLGYGVYEDETFKFNETANPIATRADSSKFYNNHLVKWNSTKKCFENAGTTLIGITNSIKATKNTLLSSIEIVNSKANWLEAVSKGKLFAVDTEFPNTQLYSEWSNVGYVTKFNTAYYEYSAYNAAVALILFDENDYGDRYYGGNIKKVFAYGEVPSAFFDIEGYRGEITIDGITFSGACSIDLEKHKIRKTTNYEEYLYITLSNNISSIEIFEDEDFALITLTELCTDERLTVDYISYEGESYYEYEYTYTDEYDGSSYTEWVTEYRDLEIIDNNTIKITNLGLAYTNEDPNEVVKGVLYDFSFYYKVFYNADIPEDLEFPIKIMVDISNGTDTEEELNNAIWCVLSGSGYDDIPTTDTDLNMDNGSETNAVVSAYTKI